MPSLPPRTDFVQSLAKGLAVIECFDDKHHHLTLSEVPIRTVDGRVVAALNFGPHAARVSMDQLQNNLLPALLETARRVSAVVGVKMA